MVNFLIFAVGRYASFFSHLAAFLAGLAMILPVVYALVPLAAAIVLGSLSAWCRRTVR